MSRQQQPAKPRYEVRGTVTGENAKGIKLDQDTIWFNYSQYAPVPEDHRPVRGQIVTIVYTEDDKGSGPVRYLEHVSIDGFAAPAPPPARDTRQANPLPAPPPARAPASSAGSAPAPARPAPQPAPPPSTMPYDERSALIVRQVALKCAVEWNANRETPLGDVLEDAQQMFLWVMEGTIPG